MMTIQATKFTPEVLLSAPRRTPGLPNSSGKQALYTVSTYSFATHSKTSQIRVLEIESGKSEVLFENTDYSEPTWITETCFIFLSRLERGCTALMEADLADHVLEARPIATFSGSFGGIKVKPLPSSAGKEGEEEGDVVAITCTAVTKPDGSPFNPYAEPKKYTSAKVYDGLFVRHWDGYTSENRNSLWYGRLERKRKKRHHSHPHMGHHHHHGHGHGYPDATNSMITSDDDVGATSSTPAECEDSRLHMMQVQGPSSSSPHKQLYPQPPPPQGQLPASVGGPQYPHRHPSPASTWHLATGDNTLINLLLSNPLQSPVPPFGGTSDFDISPQGIAFVARDPELCPATNTKSDLYFVPLSTFTENPAPAPRLVPTMGLEGYSSSPVFSPGGDKLAWARMRERRYESGKPHLLVCGDIGAIPESDTPTAAAAAAAETRTTTTTTTGTGGDLLWPSQSSSLVQEFYPTPDGEGGWDLRPDWLGWSNDGERLYVAAEEKGCLTLFSLPSSPARAGGTLPVAVTGRGVGSVNDLKVLDGGGSGDRRERLFVTSSRMVDSSVYSVITVPAGDKPGGLGDVRVVSSNSKCGKSFGLSPKQVNEIWVPSSTLPPGEEGKGEDYLVHCLVMKPSNFDPAKKYPLAMLIHGGPQGAWIDGWSTRWNPAIFAEQGYVVVMPNPTGSTGYGMRLQDGIRENWGGRPYWDLVRVVEYIGGNMGFVDGGRIVGLGASYGGFMINWIQGHPLGRKFKALVCHDGVFSTLGQYTSEELFFPIHDFGGTFWENREGYEKWDPAKFAGEWDTPQLIIHNELDYRLPISEGLAAFNILQSRNIPSRFLTFPDENHWVLKPENSLVWHTEVLGWINKYSGVAAENAEVEAGVGGAGGAGAAGGMGRVSGLGGVVEGQGGEMGWGRGGGRT